MVENILQKEDSNGVFEKQKWYKTKKTKRKMSEVIPYH